MERTPRLTLILVALFVLSVGLAAGCSNDSGTTEPALDTVPPAIPLGISASVPGQSEVALNWAANTVDPDLAGYVVYRSQSANGGFLPVTHGTVSTNSFLDTTVEPGHDYWYSVAARDINRNESARSAPVKVTVPLQNPPLPITR